MIARQFSQLLKRKSHTLSISNEVQHALAGKTPVVALESTIITHGLPFPQNVEMALRVEKVIRDAGAVPATIAFINGKPKVGLTINEIEQLADYATRGDVNKVSRRDIAYTVGNNLQGGTTISGTMILAHLAGIKVFATGGLGGVHRGAEVTMDVSADLEELGRTPVAVVCAGPKAILDIEKTMEYLETKGCMVATMGSRGVNVPGFYTRDSGVKSPYNFNDAKDAAKIIHAGNKLGLNSGYLFCVPPPESIALDDAYVERIILTASQKANELGIKGKELTPYLLSEIAKITAGISVKTNVEFVLNNAKVGADIAKELNGLNQTAAGQRLTAGNHQPSQIFETGREKVKNYIAVVGSVAMDTHCIMTGATRMADSNPGIIRSAIGGVGHNVALAAHRSNRDSSVDTKLITSVGDDVSGSAILGLTELQTDGFFIDKKHTTAQYTSMHSSDGNLIVACADMDLPTKIPLDHITAELAKLKPQVVLTDANVSAEVLEILVKLQREQDFKLVFEPTSMAKAGKISKIRALKPFPNQSFFLATPTVAELETMFKSFDYEGKFDVDNWFPIIDSLQVDSSLKKLSKETKSPFFNSILKKGIFQMGCYLIPYIPRLVIKDGANGLYVFTLIDDVSKLEFPNDAANFSILTKGSTLNGSQVGILFEHFEIPEKNVSVINVTGAGDTLVGVLLNELCVHGDIFIGDGDAKYRSLKRAQLGAKLTVEDESNVSKQLGHLA